MGIDEVGIDKVGITRDPHIERVWGLWPEGSGVQTKLKVAGDLSVQPSTLALHSLGFIAHLQTRICHPH